MSEMKRPLKVFLYHAPPDKEVVRDLYLRLMKDGVDAWLVKERLLPGQDWKHEIHKAVREADVVVVCLSEHFNHGGFQKKQVRMAFDTVIEQLAGEIFLIPVRLEEWDRLETPETWQGVNLFEEAGYEILMRVLEARAERIGASIRRKEGFLPPIAASSLTLEEPRPDKASVAAMQGTHGILIEGSAVKIRSSPSQRRLARTIFAGLLGLAGLLLVAVFGSTSPQLDRWYRLSLMVLNETPIPTPSATTVPPKPNAKAISGNIIFLIDTSESMRGPRIGIVKSAVSDFISHLDNSAFVSVIQFDTNVELRIGLTRDHAVASKVIKSISVDTTHQGSCLYDALSAGILESSFASMAEGTKIMIVLLTDISPADLGWNCSAQSMDDIRDLKAKSPVSIFIVQVGHQYGYWDVEHIAADIEAPIYSTETENRLNEALVSISEKAPELDAKSGSLGSLPAKTVSGRLVPMVFVPPGEFTMGDNKVSLDAFWIDKTEVTNAMYAKCVQAGTCTAPHTYRSNMHDSYYGNSVFDDYPVIFVSWTDADKYCVWAGGRLPTEAEWEKAARGTEGRQFPWGDQDPASSIISFLNYRSQDATRVGSYPDGASPYGALDMAGNVGEWVADWFSIDYYNHPPASNPAGPDTGQYRVWRGGSWANTSTDWIHTYSRTGNLPTDYSSGLGFRCAREAAP